MSLPRIPAVDSVTEQPKQVTEFPDLFLSQLVVRATPGNMKASAKLQPFNYDANVISTELNSTRIEVADLVAESARVPALGQAMGLIIQATAFLAQEKTLLEKITIVENDTTLTEEEKAMQKQALEDQISTLRQGAGVDG